MVRASELAGTESEYVIPANSGKTVKESNITSTFKVFCNNSGSPQKCGFRTPGGFLRGG